MRDVESQPHSVQAWMALADLFQDDKRDIVVMGNAYSEEGVLLKALELDPRLVEAYRELATVVGMKEIVSKVLANTHACLDSV